MLLELSLALLVVVLQGLRNKRSRNLQEALLTVELLPVDRFLELHQLLEETLLLVD